MSKFQEKVTELVGQMEQTDDGKWQLPEAVANDLDEPTLYAVTAERRYRDTQGAYTRAQQESKKQEAIAAGLQAKILEAGATLTAEQKRELHGLKTTDPDKWRTKLNEYENAAETTLKTELEDIAKASADKGEMAVRQEQMAAWAESTGITLTDEVIASDLPPRFLKELSDGKVTFEQFLEKAGNFIKAEKVIQGSTDSTDDETLNLGRVAGGQEPTNAAQEGDFDQSYEKTLF